MGCQLVALFSSFEFFLHWEVAHSTVLVEQWRSSQQLNGTDPLDVFGNVTRLISAEPLEGTIASELGKLTLIEVIELSANGLIGSVPSELGQLSKLQELTIERNSVTGTVPKELGKLTPLWFLVLSQNYLYGTIPSELGRATPMVWFMLDWQFLTGTIPSELGKFSNLIVLSLGRNQVCGPIPSELGRLSQLSFWGSDSNNHSSTIPIEIGKLTLLDKLLLSDNRLSGSIPPELGNLTSLEEFVLSFNQFTGSIPSEVGRLTWVKVLQLQSNMFTGEFPDIGNLTSIEFLGLEKNRLSRMAGKLIHATQVSVSQNLLAEIPEALYNLPKTVALDLSFNKLTSWTNKGVIPAEYFWSFNQVPFLGYSLTEADEGRRVPLNWFELGDLDVSSNQLGGSVRDFLYSISHFRKLRSVSARNCSLQGDFFFGTFTYTSTGTAPDFAVDRAPAFDNLYEVNMQNNFLTGLTSSPEVHGLFGLMIADFENNNISSVLPHWWNWGGSSRVRDLNLKRNAFLRQQVRAPNDCPPWAQEFISDLNLFSLPYPDATHECTIPCRGVVNIRVDATINITMLCRCRLGYGGQGRDCEACKVDHYEHHDGDGYTLTKCLPCPHRSTTDGIANASGIEHCKCNSGYYMDYSSFTCRECAAGRYASTLGTSECHACQPGTYADKGSSNCVHCSEGFVAKDPNMGACEPCESGQFMNVRGASQCIHCPKGHFSASTNSSSCTQCSPGRISYGLGAQSCRDCEHGGSIPDVQQDVCEQCLGNMFAAPGDAACSDCGYTFHPSKHRDSCTPNITIFTVLSSGLALMLLGVAYVIRRGCRRTQAKRQFKYMLEDNCRLARVLRKDVRRLEEARKLAHQLGLRDYAKDIQRQMMIQEKKYVELDALHQIIEEGDLKVVRGSWLAAESSGFRFVRLQAVPEQAFWNHHQFFSEMAVLGVVAISYCWLHPVHPDPKGLHLAIIRRALQLRLGVEGLGQVTDIALFLDYCSMMQHPESGDKDNPVQIGERTEQERISFKDALSVVNVLYANQRIESWILHWTPPDYQGKRYDERGWPCFEKTVSSLVKHHLHLVSINDTTLQCDTWAEVLAHRIKRNAPCSPDAFKTVIDTKSITNGSDREILYRMYKATFFEVIGNAQLLWFVSQSWSDEEARHLVEVFPSCTHLKEVILCDNEFTSEAAISLVQAAAKCETINTMNLSGNLIDDNAKRTMEQIWESAGKDRHRLQLSIGRKSGKMRSRGFSAPTTLGHRIEADTVTNDALAQKAELVGVDKSVLTAILDGKKRDAIDLLIENQKETGVSNGKREDVDLVTL